MTHALRTRVRADENGLRWRGVGHGWCSATWKDVRDFYDETRWRNATDNRATSSPTLVISSGLLRVSGDCNNLAEFRRIVRERATSARVAEWEPLGVRRVDEWPQTFRYWDHKSAPKIAVGVVVLFAFLSALGYAFVRLIVWYASVSSRIETISVAVGMLIGYLALLVVSLRVVWMWYTIWKRRDERFTATPETIRHEKMGTGEALEVPWTEISDYFYGVRNEGFKHEGYTLVLRGADEKTIRWNRELLHSERLLAIIQRYAPKPAFMRDENAVWRNRSDREKTGGSDPATWQSGAVGMGGRVFRNRSVLNRCMLAFCTCILTILPAAAVQEWSKPGHGQFMGPVQVMGVILAPLLWGWVCYFRTRVETDDMGITHYTPFGKRFLPWFAVADYTELRSKNNVEGDPVILTGRDGKKMFFWSTLNGYEELRGEIERYAPPPKTGWKTP
ncbi:MAG: hypothetical protein H8F28_23080 [Fibrella sp.]|nr:hypothetical protein [Armatimonadota bacterium]